PAVLLRDRDAHDAQLREPVLHRLGDLPALVDRLRIDLLLRKLVDGVDQQLEVLLLVLAHLRIRLEQLFGERSGEQSSNDACGVGGLRHFTHPFGSAAISRTGRRFDISNMAFSLRTVDPRSAREARRRLWGVAADVASSQYWAGWKFRPPEA